MLLIGKYTDKQSEKRHEHVSRKMLIGLPVQERQPTWREGAWNGEKDALLSLHKPADIGGVDIGASIDKLRIPG